MLYSNRSAAHASKKDWTEALKDAEKTTEIKPDWPKGWSRKGAALHGSGDLLGAFDAYTEGLKLDPNNAQMKQSLASVENAMQAEAGGSGNPFKKMFSDPTMLSKLASNPKTAKYLSDPEFMGKLQSMGSNPNQMDLLQDPRMLEVLSVILGADISAGPGPSEQDTEMKDAEPSKEIPKADPEPQPQAEEEPDEEELAKRKAKIEADKEKALGTESYKKRNFEVAIEHYSKAWEIHKDITYLNNLGAAYFEKGDYQACIDSCTKAIEEGRVIYADFKLIAKSYARIGTSYEKMGDMEKAVEHYQMSLREHRTPEVVSKLRAAERKKIDDAKKAYIDPEKAEQAREEGNAKFKATDWPGAVAAYTEMTKRAPDDPRGYTNRAATFIKLLEFPSALEDCEKAIEKDPKFVRAYIRKAQAYQGMREYSKCLDACEEASKVDQEHHNGANAREIDQIQNKAISAMYQARENETEEQTRERLMKDPEVS